MKVVFVTGMSGTGKSSVIERLNQLGYRAVDLDEPQWSKSDETGDWIWREPLVEDLLAEDHELLFVSGCPSNQVTFYPDFDLIILLSAPADVLTHRLQTRTTNDYGKSPEELAEVLGYLKTVEPRLRKAAEHEIDTRAPLEEVVAEVIQVTNALD